MRTNSNPRAPLLGAALIFAAFLFLYLCLFRLPFIPIYTGFDENLYLFNGTRMLDGQLIYRDFFQFVTPGLSLLNCLLFKLLGARAWISGIMLILLGLGMALPIFAISRKLLPGKLAYLPAVLFLACVYGFALDNTEHWYSTLAELCAIALVIEQRFLARLAIAGSLCGLACFFMQTQGVFTVAGLALYLLWEMRKHHEHWQQTRAGLISLFAGFLVTVLATNAWFIFRVGIARFLFCTVEFPFKFYSADRDWNSFYSLIFELRSLLSLAALPFLCQALFILALFPTAYVWFLIRYRRQQTGPGANHSRDTNSLMLLTIVGLIQAAGMISAPTTLRLSAAAAPALIILVWLVSQKQSLCRIFIPALWIISAIVAVFLPLRTQTLPMQTLDLPRGPMAVDPNYYDLLSWWSQHTQPGDYVYTAAGYETLFPMALRCPAEVESVTRSDFTRPEQVANIVQSLREKKVRYVLWDSENLAPGDAAPNDVSAGVTYSRLRHLYRLFIALLGAEYVPGGDHLSPLRDYLNSKYHVVHKFDTTLEIWERNH